MNPQSRCREVNYYIHQPVFDSKTDEIKITNKKSIHLKLFLRGLDKETIALR